MVATNDPRQIISRCADSGVQVIELGATGGIKLSFANESITVAKLKESYEGWLPNYITSLN